MSVDLVLCVALFAIAAAAPRRSAAKLFVITLVAYGAAVAYARSVNTFAVHLASLDDVNEAILVEAKLSGARTLFMIDTGYAGPPVLSASFVASGDVSSGGDVQKKFRQAMSRMRLVTREDQYRAVDRFVHRMGCVTYTSGCTMRLMGIGSTVEQQADMLMCPMLQLRNTRGAFLGAKRHSGARADVFVTHTLPSSVHILTNDFLNHHAPCLLRMDAPSLELDVPELQLRAIRPFYHAQPLDLSGGAFVVTLTVGGVKLRCTVDTGAPAPLSLGKDVLDRISACTRPSPSRTLRQTGVNNEQICSELFLVRVEFCGEVFEDCVAFANSMPVEQVDGYVGMGFLRAFNMLITREGISFARSRLAPKTLEDYRSVTRSGSCNFRFSCNAASPS